MALAIARLTNGPLPIRSAGPASDGSPRSSGQRRLTPLVRDAIRRSAVPVTRHQLVHILSEDTVDMIPDAVSASLSYLRRRGVARDIDGGWIARTARVTERSPGSM